jgi:hypothetical protein
MLFFVALGLLWTFIGLLISLINTVTEEIPTIVGPTGVYLWSSLACKLFSCLNVLLLFPVFSYTIAATLISKQFNSTIANNVLLPEQLDAGFSSTGLARY